MTTGLGCSIGTVNSVTASVIPERSLPAVRTRRTSVTFDPAGGARIGGIPQFTMAVTDFADLSRDPDAVVVAGRLWSPANLVAAVVNGLLEVAQPDGGVVSTYPAVYSERQVALLRQALDLSGAGHVLLVPEPVAAAEWLAHEQGSLRDGLVLVYDLGGSSLDVAVVRIGAAGRGSSIVGEPLRSYDFGGRPLGTMIARYATDAAPGRVRSALSIVDIDGLRTEHIRDSLELVRACVRSAGLTMSDIDRVLLVGGASRPPEVVRTVAELGLPVVISADPSHCVAAGAAHLAARTHTLGSGHPGGRTPRVAVFSSAAAVSAMAMSAMTVFGPGGPAPTAALDRVPSADAAIGSVVFDLPRTDLSARTLRVPDRGSISDTRGSSTLVGDSAYGRFITPVSRSVAVGPTVTESRGSHPEPRHCCSANETTPTYANPARFTNPLPFAPLPHWQFPSVSGPMTGTPTSAPVLPSTPTEIAGGVPSRTGGVALPGSGPSGTAPVVVPVGGAMSGAGSSAGTSAGGVGSGTSTGGVPGGSAPSGNALGANGSGGSSTSGGSATSGGVGSSGGPSEAASHNGASGNSPSNGGASGGSASGSESTGGAMSGSSSSSGAASGGGSFAGGSSSGTTSSGSSHSAASGASAGTASGATSSGGSAAGGSDHASGGGARDR
ncbi:hypothetical protein D5S18_28865 [Nocardia panacis]|uniref:Hsp70 family protein n=1 Tax=Nocardia panacis TaxID=2340916 RepID=A0A3A4KC71_9NOCA|nr:Hsp70 family protein [Nocardia panacis]RJO69902.1 hypothetical protein D5S18_28865 [Nocardia panacis]